MTAKLSFKNLNIKKYIILFLGIIIGICFSIGYILGNYDPTNNLKDYHVGVLTSDKTNIAKDVVDELKLKKNVKVKYYKDRPSLVKDLNKYDSIRLGIVFGDDFGTTIKSVDDFNLKRSTVKLIQNSKINQMSSIINRSIGNELGSIVDNKVAYYGGKDLSKLVNNKIKVINKISKDISNQNNDVQKLKNVTFEKINYYSNLISDISSKVEQVKSDIANSKVNSILNYFQKQKKLLLSKYASMSKEDIFESLTKLSNDELMAQINELPDKNLASILRNNVNFYTSKIDYIKSIASSYHVNTNINIDVNKIKKDVGIINNISNILNKYLAVHSTNLSVEDHQLVVNLLNVNNSIHEVYSILSNDDFNQVKDAFNKINSYSNNDKVKFLTNIDLNELKGKLSDLETKKKTSTEMIDKLKSGLNQLADGTSLLKNELDSKLAKVDFNKISKVSSNVFSLLINPLDIRQQYMTPSQKSGEALVGFSLMLGLWIFTLFTNEIIFNKDGKLWKQYLFALVYLFIFGSVHYLCIRALNISVNYWWSALSVVFIGYVFYTIQRFFFKVLGPLANLILTILFIIQVTCSNATVPIELMNSFFVNTSKYVPLKYGTNIFRELTSVVNYNDLFNNYKSLSIFAIVFHILNLLITILKSKKGKNDK